jgi:hypothetical protein
LKYVAIDLVNGKNVIGILDDSEIEGSPNIKIIFPMNLKIHTLKMGPNTTSETVSGSPYLLFSDDVYTVIPKSKIVTVSNLSDFTKKLYMFLIDKHQTMDELIRAGVHHFIERDLLDFKEERRMVDKQLEEIEDEEEDDDQNFSSEDTSDERVLH